MSKAYMPFYIGDYMADAGHLSYECHGPYILLLFRLWTTGGKPLPLDVEELREICRVPNAEIFDKIWQKIKRFFIQTETGYFHKRVALELKIYTKKVKKCRKSGSLGGKKRQANAQANATKTLKQSESESVKDKDINKKEKEVEEKESGRQASAPPRRSRICPESFQLTEDLKSYALAKGLSISGMEAEYEKFRDHEFKEPKSDWTRTWRIWVRRAVEMQTQKGGKLERAGKATTGATAAAGGDSDLARFAAGAAKISV